MAHRIERLRLALRRQGPWRIAALLLVVLLVLVMLRAALSREGADEEAPMQSIVVTPRPFAATIGFAGTIVPGDAVEVTAPFDATVRAVGFSYGDRVTAGQVLVELDLLELAQSRNEAESAYLKASHAAAEIGNWTAGPEVSRARRAAAAAALDLEDTDRRIAETRALLDRGLVPRSEYDGLLLQQRTQRMAAAAAREELGAVLRRGQGVNRRVAVLDLSSARTRLDQLDHQFEAAVVRAPDAGVIVRPPADKSDASAGAIRVGSRLGRGQLIGSIARAGGLGVTFQLDEADVNQLRPGQAVTVTGPGFGGIVLSGRIHSVAGEATENSAAGGAKAGFAAVARLDPLTAEQAALVRIGMTAMVSVITYNNPSAFVVPPEAIQGNAPATTVAVRDRRDGATRQVPVRVGRIAPEGVEVLSGLRPGDTVLWAVPQVSGAGQETGQ